jgi:hypothetical protein
MKFFGKIYLAAFFIIAVLDSCNTKDSFVIDPEHRIDELIDTTVKHDTTITDRRIAAKIVSIDIIEDAGAQSTLIWLKGQYLLNKSSIFIDTTKPEILLSIDDLEIENRVPLYMYSTKQSKLNKINIRLKNAGIEDTLRLDGGSNSGKWCSVVLENLSNSAKYMYEGKDLMSEYIGWSFMPDNSIGFIFSIYIPVSNGLPLKTALVSVKIKY